MIDTTEIRKDCGRVFIHELCDEIDRLREEKKQLQKACQAVIDSVEELCTVVLTV